MKVEKEVRYESRAVPLKEQLWPGQQESAIIHTSDNWKLKRGYPGLGPPLRECEAPTGSKTD